MSHVMKKLTSLVIFVVASMCSHATTLLLDTQDTIDVLHSVSPPKNMTEEVLQLVFPKLKNVISSTQVLSHKRIENLLDSDKPFCTTNRLKTTQRLEKYLFSAATDIYSGLRLYRHGSTENLTQPKNESKNQSLPLSTLVNSESKNILAVLANHSYGDAIDREIVKINKNQLYIFETINPYEQFINLFLSGKVQFIITYPEVMQPFIESDEYHIIGLEIAGESQFKFGYVMCNKHEENHRFISELNTALFSLYDSGKFAQIASKHLLPSQAEKLNAVLPSLVE